MRIANMIMIVALATTPAFSQSPDEASGINKLQKEYRNVEQTAAETAASLRTARTTAGPDSNSTQVLEDRLRAEVRRAFELRLKLQRLILADAERKLKATRERLDQRQTLAEQIIDRRWHDLAHDADTDWESDPLIAPKNTMTLGHQTREPSQPPAARLNTYRRFLVNAIASVQARRGERLEGIAKIEQDYLEVKAARRPPVSSSPDEVAKFQKIDKALAGDEAKLKKAMELLTEEVSIYDQQIDALRKKLHESVQEQDHPVALHGHVLKLNDDGGPVIDLGGEDGIAPGMKLEVVRDGNSIRTIEILDVQSDTASSKIVSSNEVSTHDVQPGDRVRLRLDSFELAILGLDDGTPIYNERLKRFKFRLEHIDVYDVAEAGQKFWRRYLDRGNPEIKGVWGDPRTNSLVIIAPPEAEQSIREAIARDESLAATGFDPGPRDSLEDQQRRLASDYKRLIKDIAERKLEIIDAKAEPNPNENGIAESANELAKEESKLQTTIEKLKVVNESLEQRASIDQ